MIEILFSDSACGSLKSAQDSADVFGFSLALSVGRIAEDNAADNRRRVLERLYDIYQNGEGRQEAQKAISEAAENLEAIHQRLNVGEAVRIWYSDCPDDMCGLYWFLSQLYKWKLNDIEIIVVKLPVWEEKGKNATQRSGWNEVSPEEWHRYLNLQKSMPAILLQKYAFDWQELQSENASLRAVLNGQLVSAPDTLYDNFILRGIAAECDEFREANLIGHLLCKYRLGVSDALFALRIEEMIDAGKLKVVSAETETGVEDMSGYRRILKKCR